MTVQGNQAVKEMIAERKERLRVMDEERNKLASEVAGLEMALDALADESSNVRDYADDELKTVTASITDAIAEVLSEQQPLHRGVILERVKARGIVIEATDEMKYFGNFLSSDERFMRRKGARGFWMLADPDDGLPESC